MTFLDHVIAQTVRNLTTRAREFRGSRIKLSQTHFRNFPSKYRIYTIDPYFRADLVQSRCLDFSSFKNLSVGLRNFLRIFLLFISYRSFPCQADGKSTSDVFRPIKPILAILYPKKPSKNH